MLKRATWKVLLSALLCSTSATAALAQEGAEALEQEQAEASESKQSQSDSVFSDDIVVTATRREENLQDVPISVSAFSGEMLEQLNIESAGKLAQLAPNVEFKKQWGSRGNSSLFYVRGIGQADFNEGSESPTTVFVDDFYVLSNSVTDFLMHDVAGAEILRGPQGTLFGRNSTAGAVVVRNNRPDLDEWGALASISAGNHNHTELEGMVNVPLVEDKLAVRFAAYRDRHDPTTENLFDGPGPGGNDILAGNFLSLRGMARWKPIQALTIDYKYQYGWVHAANGGDSSQPMMQIPGDTIRVPTDGFGYTPGAHGADSRHVLSDGVNDFRNEVNHHLLNGELQISDSIKLYSITGYLKQSKYTLEDCDGTPRTICHAYNTVDQDWFTQEARLAIDLDRSQLTFGAFYLKLDYDNLWVLPVISGTGTFQGHASIQPGDTPGGLVQITPNTAEVDSYSVYGNINYDVLPNLRVNAGVRWNKETRDFHQLEGLFLHNHPDTGRYTIDGNTFGILALTRTDYLRFIKNNIGGPIGDPPVDFTDRFKTDFLTYQVGLDYRPVESLLLYVSHKKGVKAGGFNNGLANFSANEIDAIPFGNESNFAYEVGTKWTANSRIRINGAAFYYDYKDYQATSFSVTNASLGVQVINRDAKIFGAEIEVFANPIRGLDFFVGAGWVDTKVEDITKISGGVVDIRDRELGQAPRFQSTGLVRYEADFFGGKLANQFNYSYIGKRFVDVFNDTATRLPAHLNIDYAISYEPNDGPWFVEGYIKNVFNDTDETQMFNFASLFRTGQINYFPPRFYGVKIGIRF